MGPHDEEMRKRERGLVLYSFGKKKPTENIKKQNTM